MLNFQTVSSETPQLKAPLRLFAFGCSNIISSYVHRVFTPPPFFRGALYLHIEGNMQIKSIVVLVFSMQKKMIKNDTVAEMSLRAVAKHSP